MIHPAARSFAYLMRFIILPVQLLKLYCSTVCRVAKFIFAMFGCMDLENEETREWGIHMRHRSVVNKELSSAGKAFINHRRSGRMYEFVRTNFERVLSSVEKEHQRIISSTCEYLSRDAAIRIFGSERAKSELEVLKKEYGKLSTEVQLQKRRFEMAISQNNQQWRQEGQKLEQKIVELSQHGPQHSFSPSFNTQQRINDARLLQKQQQRLEQTLKFQNDIINDLKQRLWTAERSLESERVLNKKAEIKPQSHGQTGFRSEADYQSLQQDYEKRHHQLQQRHESEIQALREVLNQRDHLLRQLKQENSNLRQRFNKEVAAVDGPQQNAQTELRSNEPEVDPYVRDALDNIERIRKGALQLEMEVQRFDGVKQEKRFLHLKELLVRTIVKLDNVDSEGHHVIRLQKKEVIKFVQNIVNILEAKAK